MSDGLGRIVCYGQRRWPKDMQQTIALRKDQRKRGDSLGEDGVMLQQSAMSTGDGTGGVTRNGSARTEADMRAMTIYEA